MTGFKIASSLIPIFDGENLPVLTFIEYCWAAVQAIERHEEILFIVCIRTRLTKTALQRTQGKRFDTLDDLLDTLKRGLSQKKDKSQLLQQMTNVSRGNNELIADYAQRVSNILMDMIICIGKGESEKAQKTLIKYARATAIHRFLRGLDMLTISFLKREPTTFDEAIDLVTRADMEAKCWGEIHNKASNSVSWDHLNSSRQAESKFVPKKQVAHMRSSENNIDEFASNMRCFSCNEIGHKKQECPNSNAKGNNKRKKSPEIQCEYRARNGHEEQDCYLKAKHMRHREFVMSKNKSLNAKPSRGFNPIRAIQSFQRVMPD